MPELLKNRYYNYNSLHELALRISAAYHPFQVDDFIREIIDEIWDSLELKARMRKITINLGKYLPADYKQALRVIDKVVARFPPGFYDFSFLCFPDFVEVFGQDECHWDLSVAALERYSPSSTSEMAVRPFIINHEERMMRQMTIWAKSDNEHIRRLASEGCRPQLPWGQVLASFKKDPSPVLAILELLKADPSLYVRKSVANNLNDISKTHPELIAKIARDWYGNNEHTDWIVKHGCRTLLKKGNKDVLEIFGFADARHVDIDGFALDTASVVIGEDITFSFTISANETTKVRLEYGIDYVKANGKRNRKIFQISEISLKAGLKKAYTKTHSFADLSSRKHYPGVHSITLFVNGTERGTLDFKVLPAESSSLIK
ncbi:MAG: DNA alkylation repair protein [Clostridia bacterium]